MYPNFLIWCYLGQINNLNFYFISPLVPYGVYILPPIETKGMDESQVNELIEKTYGVMREVFDLTAKASREELANDLRLKAKWSGERIEITIIIGIKADTYLATPESTSFLISALY